MKLFIEDLNHRADEFADSIVSSSVAQTFVVGGRWGSGRSSLLRALKPRLIERGLKPVVVSPPQRDMDTGPAALLQIAGSLHTQGLANGELAILEAPDAPWSEKLARTLACIERNKKIVVLLCEEPAIWAVPPTADETFSPYSNQHIQEVVDAIQHQSHCRRVLTSSSFRDENVRRYDLPGDSHPSWLLGDGAVWGDMASVAHELHARLGANLGVATPLEIRLLVALAAATSVTEVVSYYLSQWPDCQSIARRLASNVAANNQYARLRTLWAQLALCREFVDQPLLDWLDVGSLAPHENTLLYHGLLHRREDGYELNHVLRFQETVTSWLDAAGRIATHRKLAGYNAAKIARLRSVSQSILDVELEGYHHACLAPSTDTLSSFRVLFVDQLNKLGKTYSKDQRKYAAAAETFREAIRWDDQNDYAHHYLAYNIDWLANDPTLAEGEYCRAIELNPQHPWWWSRVINFLITLGRPREAREQWKRAVDALNLTGGEGPETVYQSLHLSVARLLLHRAQLDFADTVLNETPAGLRKNDRRFGALENLLAALREAERARSVFPLAVPFNEWWSDKPHLDFPEKQKIVKWFPAQVDAVEGETIRLFMGKRAADGRRAECAHVELPRSKFDAATLDEASGEFEPGRFLELAFYGAEETLRIRSHPDVPWQSPDLPPIDPDPRRYLRKAGIAR